ncbi:hypothetical protein GCL60_11845 [Silvanigrella paludirubra]|uniref:Uncharacterized protein n=1 Tax=Silvanigrella paludirubra TaxID=2499159 RepID=A0A6N6VR25_9BACT|nr:hypothetical protein [Silvanigrella paludirubra]KAB8037860.1 hypothetical protein GCL60_11845 [Silvanigrella paludirubra]
MSDSQIYAYFLKIMVKEDSFETIKALFFKHFMFDLQKYKSNIIINKMDNIEIKSLYLYKDQGIAVSITNEFRGVVVNLITDNNLFFRGIDNSILHPPPPLDRLFK